MTTINHAFASAIAPVDRYDLSRVHEALQQLGQDPDVLTCVYCGRDAETWDHLTGLVRGGVLNGYGHQVGNLVPCCKPCNSKKGGKDWRLFLREQIKDHVRREATEARLEAHLKNYGVHVDLEDLQERQPELWARYEAIKRQVFSLMQEADDLARELRRTT